MVPDLFFYQLLLVALLWLCVMLQWAGPSDPATCPTTPEITPLPPQRHPGPRPFEGFTTKPHCDACASSSAPHPQTPSVPPPHIVPTRGRRREVDTSRHFCPNPDCAYRGWVAWGNLRANGHPNGGPWRSCCVSPVAAIFSRPSAPSSMASGCRSSSSYASSHAWRRGWASGARPACSRWIQTPCCSSWWRRPSSCGPFPAMLCTTCG